jgi:hypothetical protein
MNASTIDQQVSLSVAVRRYLQASERYHRAAREFQEACEGVRERAALQARYVIEVDFRHWLLETDDQGNFEMDEIEHL